MKTRLIDIFRAIIFSSRHNKSVCKNYLPFIVAITIYTFLFSSCIIEDKCEDITEPVLYFSEKVSESNKDTQAVSSISMIAYERMATVNNKDLQNRKIRLAHFTNHTDILFTYYLLGQTYRDKVSVSYERKNEYTDDGCGFRVTVRNITVTKQDLHIAKKVQLSGGETPVLQLYY